MVHAKLTQGIIYAAIEGFESRKRHINQQIAELRALGNGHTPEGSAPPKTKKRGMSAAGRRAIAEAQRKRWAAAKGQGETSRVTKSTKRKRVLSAAGRANHRCNEEAPAKRALLETARRLQRRRHQLRSRY
jgi:cell division septum initiation protein DivIVA